MRAHTRVLDCMIGFLVTEHWLHEEWLKTQKELSWTDYKGKNELNFPKLFLPAMWVEQDSRTLGLMASSSITNLSRCMSRGQQYRGKQSLSTRLWRGSWEEPAA